ncbi:hypothetical protein F5051DRAFT_422654 [Lentinula edodes]|nr:hypothetical protein F5051DRAFT_422654 [Lentinula edodes]
MGLVMGSESCWSCRIGFTQDCWEVSFMSHYIVVIRSPKIQSTPLLTTLYVYTTFLIIAWARFCVLVINDIMKFMGIACSMVRRRIKRSIGMLGGSVILVAITAAPADPARNLDTPISPTVLNAVLSPTLMTGANNRTLRPMDNPPARVTSPRSAIRQWRRRWS